MIGLHDQARAEAACKIVNQAIALDSDPFTVSTMLAWIGARITQRCGTEPDLRAYVKHMHELADRIEREGVE